jgi:putative transposase
LRPLAQRPHCPRHLARAAARDLGLSERRVYALVRSLREAHGELTALLPEKPTGGRGRSRLPRQAEAMMSAIIDEVYLTTQKRNAAAVVREVTGRCAKAGLRPPAPATIRRRLKALSLADRARRGEEPPHAQALSGQTPPAAAPLDLVQIDHTRVDLILVDPIERAPIGRPWVTVAIDAFSRCIAGVSVSLEAPSATSVGLCLTHVAADKAPWLAQLGIEGAHWPVRGKPRCIGVDNGPEFHSAAFVRGCEQHGIAIDWRPPGRPHFGGIVERVIGTLMDLVHGLPGTTFSNPERRGSYDSDKATCLALEELERWLGVAITKFYHLRPHEGLDGELPLRRYEAGTRALAAQGQSVPAPRDPRAFLVDFLPVVRRTLQRDGITIDHITYYSNALRPWIEARPREAQGLLVIRRDPRDLSRVFVLDRRDGSYLEVPYRTLSRPAISLWEHRLARRRIRERCRAGVNEESLFAAVEELRAIERDAVTLTRSARRNRARRAGSASAAHLPGVTDNRPPALLTHPPPCRHAPTWRGHDRSMTSRTGERWTRA